MREREVLLLLFLFCISVGRRAVLHGYFDASGFQDNNDHHEQLSACHFLFLLTMTECSSLFAYDDVTIL